MCVRASASTKGGYENVELANRLTIFLITSSWIISGSTSSLVGSFSIIFCCFSLSATTACTTGYGLAVVNTVIFSSIACCILRFV